MSSQDEADGAVFEKPTGRLRWLADPRTVTAPPRLQMHVERFQLDEGGRVRWREYGWRYVPTVSAKEHT